MEFDYELARNLTLVIIPTVIGVIGSNILVNSWQIRKEKFALRKEILSMFNDTFPKANLLNYQLFVSMAHEYATSPRNAKMTDTTIEGSWTYPTKEEDKPSVKFSEDLKKTVIETLKIHHKSYHFQGLLSLYYVDAKKMDDLITSILNSLEKTIAEMKLLVYARNLDELTKSVSFLHEHFDKNFGVIYKLQSLLITEKLKDPQESIWKFSFFKHK